jgi:hypothetical protein
VGKKDKGIAEREKAWRGDRAEKRGEEGLERRKRLEKPWERGGRQGKRGEGQYWDFMQLRKMRCAWHSVLIS